MLLYSTRNHAYTITFDDAVLQGLAPDGGLFLPVSTPDLRHLIAEFDSKTDFKTIASSMLQALFPESFDEKRAEDICKRAFPFAPRLLPLRKNISLIVRSCLRPYPRKSQSCYLEKNKAFWQNRHLMH